MTDRAIYIATQLWNKSNCTTIMLNYVVNVGLSVEVHTRDATILILRYCYIATFFTAI